MPDTQIPKAKMHSPDLTQDNIAKIRDIFPGCVTEAADDKGAIRLAVDFDQLRQELSGKIVEGPQERYRLDWPGKREALLTANASIAKTLRPVRDESVNFDTTQNLFIEGDNLDALKLLQESYLGKVKMIYIDPPYNTGNDFIYEDDFAEDSAEFLARSNQKDEKGNRLIANTDSNGRFHSDWLSMIYSRIRIARNFLADDGVFFATIGDDEVSNFKTVCDEIFGEANFISLFAWEKRTNRENRKVVSSRHDHLLCYVRARSKSMRALNQLPMSPKALANYKNPDNDPRGAWKSDPATAQAGHGTKSQFYTLTAPSGKKHELESGRCWLYTETVMQREISDGKIWFGRKGDAVPRVKTYLESKDRGLTPESIFFAEEVGTNEAAKNQLKELFGSLSVFDTPKPVDLVKQLIRLSCENGIVVDFFAGSSATADALMQLNSEDGGDRKFVMVQLPEALDDTVKKRKDNKDAIAFCQSIGVPFNIAEISKERIRRAGSKILEGETHKDWNKDVGFRVLKVDTSNMADIWYMPEDTNQADMVNAIQNIKPDRSGEDLLFQLLIDWGVDLSLPIARETMEGKTIYRVDDNALIACFDNGVNEALVKKLAALKPLRAVFKDNGFADNATKINVTQIFKQLSPDTDVKSI